MSGRRELLRRWWPLLGAVAALLAFGWARGLFVRAGRLSVRPARTLASPLARAARSLARPAPSEADRLRAQVLLLKLENASLREDLDRVRARAAEHHLVFPDQRLARLLPCSVLFRDPATWFKGFSVDAGGGDGIREGAGVLDDLGVVGKLTRVGSAGSDVLLLSDPGCRLSARLPRSGLRCVVSGDGRGGCLLEHLGGEDDVRVGDLVETGEGSLSFPVGVPVGKVLRVAREDEGLRLRVEVEPAAALDRLDGLYVWTGEPRP